jgi:hypothetical protein
MISSASRSTAPRPFQPIGPSRIVLVTPTDRREPARDATALIVSESDGFRGVRFQPARLAKRQTAAWRGLSGEVIRIVSQDSFESDYHGPCHLLVLYTQAARHRGESTIEGLPRSTLHDFSGKLTFVTRWSTLSGNRKRRAP